MNQTSPRVSYLSQAIHAEVESYIYRDQDRALSSGRIISTNTGNRFAICTSSGCSSAPAFFFDPFPDMVGPLEDVALCTDVDVDIDEDGDAEGTGLRDGDPRPFSASIRSNDEGLLNGG